jgi:hypothetical protein
MTDNDTPDQEPQRGQMRFQDPSTTTPREPTVAEQRARRKAIEEEQAREQAELEAVSRRSSTRRKVLIGSGVTVGLVALVSVWYSAAQPDEVTANCVDPDNAVSSDENICTDDYVTSHGGYSSGGFYYLPFGGGYRSYHYNYGGSVDSTGHVSGGSTAKPSGHTTVKSSSGKTVSRGGFGISGGGKSGGS